MKAHDIAAQLFSPYFNSIYLQSLINHVQNTSTFQLLFPPNSRNITFLMGIFFFLCCLNSVNWKAENISITHKKKDPKLQKKK